VGVGVGVGVGTGVGFGVGVGVGFGVPPPPPPHPEKDSATAKAHTHPPANTHLRRCRPMAMLKSARNTGSTAPKMANFLRLPGQPEAMFPDAVVPLPEVTMAMVT
jgi:hypothetical protein